MRPIYLVSLLFILIFSICCSRSDNSNGRVSVTVSSSSQGNATSTSSTQAAQSSTKTYIGQLDNSTRGYRSTSGMYLKLIRNGNKLSGTLSQSDPLLEKGTSEGNPIEGTIDEQQNIVFRETYSGGTEGATYKGRFTLPDVAEGVQTPDTGGVNGAWCIQERTGTDVSSLEGQAKIAVEDAFVDRFTKCGDSYFSTFNNFDERGIRQYKNPRFVVSRANPTTEADRLNGITWSGQIDFVFDAARVNNGSWGAWGNYTKWSEFTFNVTNTNGRWQTESAQAIRFNIYQKVLCSNVPQQ